MTKVAIIGTNGIPARYGGFETLAEYLARFLNQDYDLYCYCSKRQKGKNLSYYLNTKLIYLPFSANGWQSMVYDVVAIMNSFVKHDVLVILGFSGVFAFPLKRLFNKFVIFNIGGIEWQKVRGKKITAKFEVFAKKWFEKICVKYSDVIVVDNQVLYDYVQETYQMSPVLIEYGGDHAEHVPIKDEFKTKYPFLNLDYDVSISRAQEDMNIHLIIEAYKRVNRNLVVVSNWQISEYGLGLKAANKDKYPNIFIVDSVYDLEELNTIRSNCKLYLHTHSLCGTAPSLVEAMSLNVPIICFDVPTNRATTEGKTKYFKDVESLKVILSDLTPETLKIISKDLYDIAGKRYTWKRITELYKNSINRYVKN